MDIKVISRVFVEKVEKIQNKMKDINSQFKLSPKSSFLISSGKIIHDDYQSFNLEFSRIPELTSPITEFLNQKFQRLIGVSPAIIEKIIHKIGEINQMRLNLQNYESLSNFSFICAGLLKSNINDKKRMFETENVLERLSIVRKIISVHSEDIEPIVIFNVDAPTQKLYSVRYSIILVLIIGFYLYYIKNRENRYYQY